MRHLYRVALSAALAWAASPAAAQQDGSPPLWSLFGQSPQPADMAAITEALGKGADPNVTDGAGNTSVHHAAGYDAGILRAVIARGGRCDARNPRGQTPMHAAAVQGTFDSGPESVRVLLDCSPASVNAQDARGNTPLHTLYLGGEILPYSGFNARRADVLEALLEGGAAPNARNEAGDTPMLLVLEGLPGATPHLSHLRLLLEHGADPDTRDGKGTPAVSLTILQRPSTTPEELVAELLKAGADPDQRDRRGDTPLLHLAKGEYDRDELEVLLAAGADPCIADRGGRLPWELALAGKLYHTGEMLEKAGGRPDPETRECPRATEEAAREEKALGLARAERR